LCEFPPIQCGSIDPMPLAAAVDPRFEQFTQDGNISPKFPLAQLNGIAHH